MFAEWNKGELDSYLIEITRDIFAFKDEDGAPMVDKILDTAGQKGTGKWTGISSLELGVPVTLIGEAVYCPLPLCDEGRARRRVEDPRRAPKLPASRRPEGIHRGRPTGAVLLEDDLLRAGLHAAA